MSVIHEEVLKQCDEIDGVSDGIIEDPSQCKFRSEKLECALGKEKDCLTPTQVEMVRDIFSPLTRENGEMVYPAMGPGNEVSAFEEFYDGQPFRYSEVSGCYYCCCCGHLLTRT